MPNHKDAPKITCSGEDTKTKECDEDTICPGWSKNVICVGSTVDNNDFDCRPCEPENEVWLALEFGNYNGACACLPQPTVLASKYREGLINLGIVFGLLALFQGYRILKKGKKK